MVILILIGLVILTFVMMYLIEIKERIDIILRRLK